MIAPAVGGLLSTYASWRWIFVINIPLGVIGLLVARRVVPDIRAPERNSLDWRGFGLTAVGIAGLVVGLEAIGTPTPDPALVTVGLALAAEGCPGAQLVVGMWIRPAAGCRRTPVAWSRSG